MFERLVEQEIRRVCYFEIDQLALRDIERADAHFVGKGEERLRLLDVPRLDSSGYLAHLAEQERVRSLCAEYVVARQVALGGVAVLAQDKGFVAAKGGDGVAVGGADGDVAADDVLRNQRSHSIVYEQHILGIVRLLQDELDAVADSLEGCLAALNRSAEFPDAALAHFFLHRGAPFGIAGHVDMVYQGVLLEGAHGVKQHAFAIYFDILLGSASAHALRLSCGQEQDDAFVLRHW